MLDQQLDQRDVDRGNWLVDEWDEVGEVPAVEPIRHQNRILKWIVWCALVSFILLKILDVTLGLRVSDDEETEGLDLVLHEERGYNL